MLLPLTDYLIYLSGFKKLQEDFALPVSSLPWKYNVYFNPVNKIYLQFLRIGEDLDVAVQSNCHHPFELPKKQY